MKSKLFGRTLAAVVTAACLFFGSMAVLPTAKADGPTIESALLAKINEGRAAAGKPAMVMHSGLRAKQRVHAQNMAAANALSHTGAQSRHDTAMPDPAESNGAPDDGFSGYWCENVAYRTRSGSTDIQVAAGLYNQWFTSTSGHKECMLDTHRAHNVAGLGIFEKSDGTIWAALLLELDSSKPSSGGVASVSATQISFSSPALGSSEGSRQINPFTASGVTFTAETPQFSDEVVGLVKDSATSACVEPKNADQLLGTGRSSLTGSIGRSGFPIRATFGQALAGSKVKVSLDVQAVGGAAARVRLFNASGTQVASQQLAVPANGGTCGNPGSARGTAKLSVETTSAVRSALVDAGSGYVFVIDDFRFEVTS